ncbi:hypothetical protein J4423_00575 [Candidatus Pacearchaeota archaeon]|nr:hypothetical protein [Candidatus Pacearchaeota archaeon]
MSQKLEGMKVTHWPTLNTVIMVEEAIRENNDSVITVAELKRKLPRQVNHNTLIIILQYLEKSNKIAFGVRGISWIHNENPILRKAISEGYSI